MTGYFLAARRQGKSTMAFLQTFSMGCSGCDIEEADGEVHNHCDPCCRVMAEHIKKGVRHPERRLHDHLVSELKRRKFLPEGYKP